MDKYYALPEDAAHVVEKIPGPILIFGAGGFIGVNLLQSLLLYRNDVYGVSQDPKNNWRFIAAKVPLKRLLSCDINEQVLVDDLLRKIKPKTIFNLAAYGAYSKQKEFKKIYTTNFNASVALLELLKRHSFERYIYTGSQSEYGTNSAGPPEEAELTPNSHYAISKTAAYYANKYYGKVEGLPAIHTRLYSVFGPWEEPDRLIPVLLTKARHKTFPPFVHPKISRDFIYMTDVVAAFVAIAAKVTKVHFGEAYNIGTGSKTTMKDLAAMVGAMCEISQKPQFGTMENRVWDLQDWFANNEKMKRDFHWEPKVSLVQGVSRILEWQTEVNYDNAFWNWTRYL